MQIMHLTRLPAGNKSFIIQINNQSYICGGRSRSRGNRLRIYFPSPCVAHGTHALSQVPGRVTCCGQFYTVPDTTAVLRNRKRKQVQAEFLILRLGAFHTKLSIIKTLEFLIFSCKSQHALAIARFLTMNRGPALFCNRHD